MGALVKSTAKKKQGAAAQEAFDFSVMVCYAVKALQAHLDGVDAGTEALLSPYHYVGDKESITNLRAYAAKFESNLSAHLLLSVFSFFEAYVNAVVEELIEFHGGIETMVVRAEKRDRKFISGITKEMSIQRYKLREKKDANRKDRYRKFTRMLEQQGFRFPTETLSSYGVRKFGEDFSRLKAFAIPDFLTKALHVPLDAEDVKYFHKVRTIRNNIAHGDASSVTLKDIGVINDFFRSWALLIDEHLLTNYFINEDYS